MAQVPAIIYDVYFNTPEHPYIEIWERTRMEIYPYKITDNRQVAVLPHYEMSQEDWDNLDDYYDDLHAGVIDDMYDFDAKRNGREDDYESYVLYCDAIEEEDVDIDVCLGCGKYYGSSPMLTEAWRKSVNYREGAVMDQLCYGCMTGTRTPPHEY